MRSSSGLCVQWIRRCTSAATVRRMLAGRISTLHLVVAFCSVTASGSSDLLAERAVGPQGQEILPDRAGAATERSANRAIGRILRHCRADSAAKVGVYRDYM